MGNVLEFGDRFLLNRRTLRRSQRCPRSRSRLVWSFNCEGHVMRANKVMNYTSILQVLGESGCPFCRFMKDVQAAALQTPGRTKINHLCNFHTWGLAAMQRAP